MKKSTLRDPYRGQDPRDMPTYDTVAAAHYLRIPQNTIRNWAFGYTRPSGRESAALLHVDHAPSGFLSFWNLVELHVLGALRRDHQVKLVNIRSAIEYLQKELRSPRPLLERTMETDGVDVFVDHFGELVNASRHGQVAMRDVLHAYLKRIDRDPKGVPVRLFPFTRPKNDSVDAPRIISIDPAVAFGRPVIVGSRVPTREVYERYMRGESSAELADDFGCTVDQIEEAVRCESGQAA
ncbi:MAG TPA: DUF433 domain-containing protein [Vicinamibacterales bacterium]|nr:DUF433 domain-containing protein [Vicinamibacterales bacterium]